LRKRKQTFYAKMQATQTGLYNLTILYRHVMKSRLD